jgi:hypothetical protein
MIQTGKRIQGKNWCNDTDRGKRTGKKIGVMILTGERVLGKNWCNDTDKEKSTGKNLV